MSAYSVGVKVGNGLGSTAVFVGKLGWKALAATGELGTGVIDGTSDTFDRKWAVVESDMAAAAAVAEQIKAQRQAAKAAKLAQVAQAAPVMVTGKAAKAAA